MLKSRHTLLVTILSALLAACGGGGGDIGDGGANNVVSSPTDPMVKALATGDASGVTSDQVVQSTLALLASKAQDYAKLKQALFGLNADGTANANSLKSLTWNPTHDSVTLTTNDAARNLVMLGGNWNYSNSTSATNLPPLAVVGTTLDAKAHYAVFGGNPIGVPGNAAMDSFIANTIAWLTPRSKASDFKVVAAHLPGNETYWFPHEPKVRQWLLTHYPNVTINGLPGSSASQQDNICDGSALAGCLQNADLLIIGREQGPNAYDGPTVMNAITAAQSRGIPVIFFIHGSDANGGWSTQASDLAYRLLSYFGLGHSDNYWTTTGLDNFDPSTLPSTSPGLMGLSDLINRLINGTFSTTWSGCSTGRVSCNGDASYMSEFGTLAGTLRSNFRQLDANGTVIFGQDGAYEIEKRLVLLGDKLRGNVSYPLDKTQNEQDFFRSLFSDVTAYVHRGYSAIAKNLGNFSGLIPASTQTITRTVSVTLPTSGSTDYITELYVMPGRTVTLTRTDSSASTVTFGLNKLRDTTWVFNTNGMDRPTQISSPSMALVANKPVSITSPYGGPLYLTLTSASGAAQTMTVKVDGVTTYPLLRDATDPTQVSAFQAAVAGTPTNWTAITTDMMTIFSTLDHMRQTIKTYTDAGETLTQMASDTWTYEIKDTYELAGFNDAAGKFSLPAKVTAFCNSKGWDCTGLQHRRDVMQYVISDVHAACGDGCSGNPYDQDWAFGPLGWGESHEVGHNIQPGRLEIYGGMSGEVSNNIFPMHKHVHYNLASPTTPAPGYSGPFADRPGSAKTAFNQLKGALGKSAPNDAHTVIWGDSSYAANNDVRVMFYRQLTEYARYYNCLANGSSCGGAANNFSDGWELSTLLYLLERNFGNASSSNWSAVATQYGFGTYANYPGNITGNDFMVVAASYIIGRDMRPVFDLWGISYSSTASSQVAAYNYLPASQFLFPMASVSAIPANVGSPFIVNSSASYPSGY